MTPDTITVTVYAPFHSPERSVLVQAKREGSGTRYFASPQAMKRAWSALCGIHDCRCALAFFARGNEVELLWWDRTQGAAFRIHPRRCAPSCISISNEDN